MGFLNKVWSGLDFWDKKENQGQRQSFAQQDEEQRKRQQAQAAAASVTRPTQPNTPGITQVNTTPKPIATAGSQSDFMQPKTPTQMFSPSTSLQKVNPTQPATTPFGGVQTPKPVTPAAPKPMAPAQPTVTPQAQVPHAATPPPNPVEIRQRATAYQNPNVQDVNNHYGSDLKVLNAELAKGDNADLHRVQGLMQSLDNRKKELQDFHDARANSAPFKTARQLGDTIKNTRGDWTKQNQSLQQFWDGVHQNETGDFNQFLAEKNGAPHDGTQQPEMLFHTPGQWKNGTGMNNAPDFTPDAQKVEEVQTRQKIADAMTSDKLRDVPLDQIPGNKTTTMHLRDFATMSPSEQAAFMSQLDQIQRDNQNNYSANPDLKRKAQQAFMLQQTLIDSGKQRQDWHTRLDSAGQKVSGFGDAVMESPKHYVQSLDVLGREIAGAPQRGDELTQQHDSGQLTDEQYNAALNQNTRDTAWAGNGHDGKNRFLIAAGTSADIVSTILPVMAAADAGKAAFMAERTAAEIAAKEGVSRTAARAMMKETLAATAEDATKSSLTRTMAKDALVNAGLSGAGSLRTGELDPSKMFKETAMGAVVGGTAPVVGDVLGKVGGKVLSKFRPSAELPQTVEDLGRLSSSAENGIADSTVRASYMTPEQSSRIKQLEQIVDDPNTPSYQKIGVHEELKQLESEVDKKMQDALVGTDTPVDTTPAYEHKNQIQQIIDDHQYMLEEHLAQIPNPTPQDIDIATQAAKQSALDQINSLKSARYGSVDPNANLQIPDPATDHIALAKADNGASGNAILPDNFAPPEKVAPAGSLEKAPPVDAQGNAALQTDAERAQQMADAGFSPAVGASPVAASEAEMAAAADRAANAQVDLANPTTGDVTPSQTAQRLLDSPNVPQETKDAITKLSNPTHNDKLMINAADNLVRQDLNTARGMFDNLDLIHNGLNLDAHVHLGNSLANEYNRIGQTAEAAKVYNDLIATTNRLGQGLRAASAISKLSPQAIVDFAARIASKNGKILSPELEQELVQTAKSVAEMAPGEEKAAAIREMIALAQQPTFGQKAGDFVKGVLSAPRGLMATGDLSFAVRQGGVLGTRYPKEWAQALKNSAEYAVSEKKFQEGMTRLANLTDESGEHLLPTFKKMGLSLNAVENGSEEAFGNTSVLESKALKKVGVGHVVAGSDRAFSGAASELRANVAKKIIDGYGGVKALESWTQKDLEDLGRVLNTATGRGQGGAWFEKAAPTLSDTLFSARLWKSRLDLLNPIYYAKLAPAARKVALQSSASFAAVVSATLGAAAAAGATVEMDPRSSDFGKIKVGNTRYDIMGGLQQNIVLAAREITGQKKNSATGEITDLTEGGFGKPNRFTTLSDFVTNKETPVLATATRLLKGNDIAGNPVNPWTEVAKLFVPLGIQDVNSLVQDAAGNGQGDQSVAEAAGNYKNVGGDVKAVAKSTPGFVGVGVQTYGGGQAKVGANQGVDPTTLDPKDLKKYENNVNKDFVKGLSKDEQRAYNLSKDSKLEKLALDKGTITQGQLDKVAAKENAALEKAGLPTNEPKNETKEAIQAHIENGDYGKAISSIDKQIASNKKDSSIPKSKTEELVTQKKRLEVTDAGHFTPDIIKLYHDTSNAEWRKMTDPNDDAYDPQTAGKLELYDKELTTAGVSEGTKMTESKFFARTAKGRGGGGGSGGGEGSHSIATNNINFDNFTPQKVQPISASAPQSAIPTLAKVADYSRKLKKINVSN